jgi:protein phosphatase
MEGLLSQVAASARTDVGLHRTLNEDSLIAEAPVFFVADGMGGHAAGEVASGVVVAELRKLVGRADVTVAQVKECLHVARKRISAIPAEQQAAAGTTVAGVALVAQDDNPYWLVVNLGDSRTYRLEGGRLEQLSVDHSEVQELIDAGRLSASQAKASSGRNVITRALGAGVVENPDYWLIPVEPGDRLLVCSDGLTSEVPDERIEDILSTRADRELAASELIGAALESGGHDNISVIVVDALSVPVPDETDDESTLRVLKKPVASAEYTPRLSRGFADGDGSGTAGNRVLDSVLGMDQKEGQ